MSAETLRTNKVAAETPSVFIEGEAERLAAIPTEELLQPIAHETTVGVLSSDFSEKWTESETVYDFKKYDSLEADQKSSIAEVLAARFITAIEEGSEEYSDEERIVEKLTDPDSDYSGVDVSILRPEYHEKYTDTETGVVEIAEVGAGENGKYIFGYSTRDGMMGIQKIVTDHPRKGNNFDPSAPVITEASGKDIERLLTYSEDYKDRVGDMNYDLHRDMYY